MADDLSEMSVDDSSDGEDAPPPYPSVTPPDRDDGDDPLPPATEVPGPVITNDHISRQDILNMSSCTRRHHIMRGLTSAADMAATWTLFTAVPPPLRGDPGAFYEASARHDRSVYSRLSFVRRLLEVEWMTQSSNNQAAPASADRGRRGTAGHR